MSPELYLFRLITTRSHECLDIRGTRDGRTLHYQSNNVSVFQGKGNGWLLGEMCTERHFYETLGATGGVNFRRTGCEGLEKSPVADQFSGYTKAGNVLTIEGGDKR